MRDGIEEDLREFLYRHFESRTALEVLLAMARDGQTWTAGRLSSEMTLSEDESMDILVTLHWQGFLQHDEASGEWRYRPRSADLAAIVAKLSRLPLSHLLAEIDAYAAPRTFAEAFRLKKLRKPGRGNDA